MTRTPALFCLRLQKNARQVCQVLGILQEVIIGCFVVCNGAWGRCRCLIRQSSTVTNSSGLFSAVAAAGRIGGLSALRNSCWVSVTSHCCSFSHHKLDLEPPGKWQNSDGWRATISSHR